MQSLAELYGRLASQAKDLALVEKQTADSMSLRLPQATKLVGDKALLVQSTWASPASSPRSARRTPWCSASSKR